MKPLLNLINAAWNRVAPPDPSPVLPGTTSRWEDNADGYLVEAPDDAYQDACEACRMHAKLDAVREYADHLIEADNAVIGVALLQILDGAS